jgi:hypothetical protein
VLDAGAQVGFVFDDEDLGVAEIAHRSDASPLGRRGRVVGPAPLAVEASGSHSDDGAAAVARQGLHVAAVGAREVAHEAEAEARAAHLAGVAGAVEAVEHALALGGGNAAAAVGDGRSRRAAAALQVDLDLVFVGRRRGRTWRRSRAG